MIKRGDNHPIQNVIIAGLFAAMAVPSSAAAFCGFYIGGSGAEMFNDATEVALLRHETTTVMSMRNRYQGDPNDFAMVVPVPTVLEEADVKTLDHEIFNKIDTLGSPRLVEYWEQDPCNTHRQDEDTAFASPESAGGNNAVDDEVTVEAQFTVGEYEIVILSAEQGSALDDYFVQNNYQVPGGAADFYQPYIDAGQYFFVAKVDPTKVTFKDGQAVLSPLRFAFESTDFSLPIRLGLINSNGQQDLIVHILAQNQRYEVANYPNVTIPTNIEVVDSVRQDFGSFYRALFARTLKENPAAAVTEYSWDASSCDPCPGPVALGPEDFMTLGQDVIAGATDDRWFNWTLTRIHTRYDKSQVGEDLVFRKATAIVGGREVRDEGGNLETGATPNENGQNTFQGRYIIRHEWDGDVDCEDPQFDHWGGDPNSPDPWGQPSVTSTQGPNSNASPVFENSEETPLEEKIVDEVPELNLTPVESPGGIKDEPKAGCSAATFERGIGSGVFFLILGMCGLAIRRRKRSD